MVLIPLRAFMLILVAIPEPAGIYPSSHISAVSPFVLALLSAPSNLGSPLCNAHDLCENDSISSYRDTGRRVQWSGPFEIVFVLDLR